MLRKVLSKRDNKWVWQIDATIAGQRIRHSGFATKDEADQAFQEMKRRARAARYGMPIDSQITLGDLLEERRRNKRVTPPLIRILENFVDAVGPTTRLRAIGKVDLRSYQTKLLERCRPGTVNFRMAIIVAALNSAAVLWRDFEDYRAPTIKQIPAPNGRDRVLSQAEIAGLYQAMKARPGRSQDVADLFALMLLTGCRIGELQRVSRHQVDFGRRVLAIFARKTQTSRVVPLCATAVRILEQRLARRPVNATLFPAKLNGSFQGCLKAASKETGLIFGQNIEGGWVLYDCRHTVATILAEAGVNFAVIVALLGHSKRALGTTGIYTNISFEALRKATIVLEEHCRLFDGSDCEKVETSETLRETFPKLISA